MISLRSIFAQPDQRISPNPTVPTHPSSSPGGANNRTDTEDIENKRRISYVRPKTRTEVGTAVRIFAALLILLAVVGTLFFFLFAPQAM